MKFESFSTRKRPQIENSVMVETEFLFSALLLRSSIAFSWFQAIGQDHDVLQAVIELLPPNVEFTCPFPELNECDKVSIAMINEQPDQDFVDECCHIGLGILDPLDLQTQVDQILLGFFRSALSEFSDHSFKWPARSVCNAAKIYDNIKQALVVDFSISPLRDCTLFINKVDSEKCMLIAMPNQSDLSVGVFACQILEISRPDFDSKENMLDFESIKFQRPQILDSADGTVFLRGSSSKRRLSDPHSAVSESSLLALDNWDNGWAAQVKACYKSSLAKAVYFSLLSQNKIYLTDVDRGLTSLDSFKMSIDMTNFVFVCSLTGRDVSFIHSLYRDLISRDFSKVSSFLHEEKQTSLLFHTPSDTNTLKDKIMVSSSPLFLEISSISSRDPAKSNRSESLPSPFYDNIEELAIPCMDNSKHVELVFEIFSIKSEAGLTCSQKKSLDSLKAGVEEIIFDFILSSLLGFKKEVYDDSTAGYINDMLINKHLPVAGSFPEAIEEQHSFAIRLEVVLIDPKCIEFMRQDMSKFECLGSKIYTLNERCYSYYTKDRPFWLMINLSVEDSTIDVHIFFTEPNPDLIIEAAVQSIQKCAERANQRFLLVELADTHMARYYKIIDFIQRVFEEIHPEFSTKSEN